jgi:hypothetical protein
MGNMDINRIQVASPCSVPWDQMVGDDQIRHCGECQLNVYNLSTMTTAEITTLLTKKEGRTCVRFFRRTDGTVLTQDCPVGLAAVRRRLRRIGAAVAAALLAAIPALDVLGPRVAGPLRKTVLGKVPVVRQILAWMDAPPPTTMIQGKMKMPLEGHWVGGDPTFAPKCTPAPPQR